jgi:hypothetical protein
MRCFLSLFKKAVGKAGDKTNKIRASGEIDVFPPCLKLRQCWIAVFKNFRETGKTDPSANNPARECNPTRDKNPNLLSWEVTMMKSAHGPDLEHSAS